MQMAIMYKNRLLCIITNYVNEPWHIHAFKATAKQNQAEVFCEAIYNQFKESSFFPNIGEIVWGRNWSLSKGCWLSQNPQLSYKT